MASHSYASSCKVTRQCHSNTFIHPSASRNVYLYSFVSRTLKVLKLPHWPLLNLRFQWLIFPHRGAWFQATIAVTKVECWPVHVYGQPLWIKAIDENIFDLHFQYEQAAQCGYVARWRIYMGRLNVLLIFITQHALPHLPSLTTDCCLVGIVIKRTFETSQRVWSRVKRKNANVPV